MIDDVCLTGHDFLATFPVVRQIERQRLALGLESTPTIIAMIQAQTEALQQAAGASEIVAPGAVDALKQNEPDIQNAVTIEQTADLVGDKLLVTRNFVSETIRVLKHKSGAAAGNVWDTVGSDFRDGARMAARMVAPLGLIALIVSIAGPIAGLAGLLQSGAFRSVHNAVSKVRQIEDEAHRTTPKKPE